MSQVKREVRMIVYHKFWDIISITNTWSKLTSRWGVQSKFVPHQFFLLVFIYFLFIYLFLYERESEFFMSIVSDFTTQGLFWTIMIVSRYILHKRKKWFVEYIRTILCNNSSWHWWYSLLHLKIELTTHLNFNHWWLRDR